jgi:hypothetical protein
MTTAPRFVASAIGCLVLAAVPCRAFAQDTEATATALFDQGRRLMAEHHYAEACPKLAESQRLAPSGGTLINLAECYEHTGQTASAWAAWQGAAARANAAGKASAEKSALARAAALEPLLGKLTIVLGSGADVPELVVKRDGVPVGQGELGSALPVDPGTHTIEAAAPRKKPVTVTVTVAARQTDVRVTVALEDDATASQPQASTATTVSATVAPTGNASTGESPPSKNGSWGAQKIAGVTIGAAGVVGLAVGAAFGLSAKSKNDEALQSTNCRTSTLCDQTGLSLTSDAKSSATASTIAFVAGGVAVAAGAVLWLTAPRGSTGSSAGGIRAIPVVAQSYGGLAVDGAW